MPRAIVSVSSFLLAFLALVPPAWAAASLPGFPKKTGKPIGRSAIAADLTGAGELSLIAVSGDRIVAYGIDGQSAAGFPVSLGAKETAAGEIAAADMDGDKKAEVAVATTSGKLFLISNGAIAPGFPITLEAGCAAGPSFADVDGDGKPELLQGDKAGQILALTKEGKSITGFPFNVGAVVTSSVSAGILKGELALAVGTEAGPVHVLDLRGKPLAGFPLNAHFAVPGAPAFGDLDDDGKVDLVVASKDFNLYAVDEDGKSLPGFPVVAGFAIDGAPALGDLNDDGALEVAFAAADGNVYVVNGKGKVLPGFPLQLKGSVAGGVAIGDLDRDGKNELVIASSDGLIHALGGAKELRGFPTKLSGELTATPFLAKLGRDGHLFALVGSPEGALAAVRFEGALGQAPASAVWAGAGHDAARTGRFYPSPGRYKDLAIVPATPKVDDGLRGSWVYFSVDGAEEPSAAPIAWFKDAKPQKELDGKRDLPARTAKKGERWRFELKLGTRVARSPEVMIQDSAPSAPEVRLLPEAPSRVVALKAELAKPAVDPDGDPVGYRYSWLVDGMPVRLAGPEIPAAQLKKGQRWSAVVIASDGTMDSPAATAEAVVANAAPGAPVVALAPASPRRGDEVKPVVQKPAADPDSDAVRYRYRWSIDGEPRNYPDSKAALPSEVPRKGQKIEVAAWAFDGEADGPPATASVTMANTPPPAPQVAIVPAAPRSGQALRAVVIGQTPDADGDSISYRAAWTRSGKPFTGAGPGALEVPAKEVKSGESWSVQVTPNDGEADGPPGTAQALAINTPPSAPLVAIEPAHPRVASALEVKVLHPSEDQDGEAVRYGYSWARAGKPVSAAKDKTRLPAGEFKKHEKVRVAVTPFDAAGKGSEGLAEVEIENSPPGAPAIAFEPATPTSQRPLKVVVTRPAPDDDADPLSYRYRWFRDGALMPFSHRESASQPFREDTVEVSPDQLKKGSLWTVVVRAHDGEALGPPVSASVRIGNSAPAAPKVSLAPQPARRGTGLRAVLTDALDPDGDPVSYRYEWRRDGKPLALPSAAASVARADAEAPKKGELWSVEVIASDGQAESLAGHAEARIANSPPTAPRVALCDGPVKAGAVLEVKLTEPSIDVDGDAISYRYRWTVSGKAAPALEGKKTLGPGESKKHDLLRVTVTPSDGSDDGPPGYAECAVEDSAPTAPEIALDPAAPSAETGVRVKVTRAAEDHDGDPISYRYAWTRDGLPFAPGGSGDAVKPGQLKRGEVLAVTVTSDDGELRGGQASASVRVKNTVPAVPKVALLPARPVTGSKLTCAVEIPKDADGDPVTVGIAWLKDAKPTSLAIGQAELPAGVVRKGEDWACEAWGDDGFGTSARDGAKVTVANSAPGAPEVTVEPEHPGTGTELRCRITAEARDLDGDKLWYQYRWFENGKAQASGPEPARVAAERTKRGKKWRCEVVASDGALEGPPASAERAVGNSPPPAARVALKPRTPKPQQPLECDLLAPSSDPDGDPVTYRFAWLKDGALQKGSTRPVLAGGQVKSGDLWSCQVVASDGELEGPPASSGDAVVP